MIKERLSQYQETIKDVTLSPPPIESFLDTSTAKKVWPPEIANDPEFIKQIENRRDLVRITEKVFSRLSTSDQSLESAINAKKVEERDAKDFYFSLNHFLESNPDCKRLLLYLPFEILPDEKWKFSNEGLNQEIKRFNDNYLDHWHDLLGVNDLRANFSNGDINDEEQRTGNLPRVVKAAHLSPFLVKKGILQVDEIIRLMETSEDRILNESFADALSVIYDLDLLTEQDLKKMESSIDQLVNNIARLIRSGSSKESTAPYQEPLDLTQQSLQEILNDKFSTIETENHGKITDKRKAWLAQIKKQEAIIAVGNKISYAIINDKLPPETINNLISTQTNPVCRQTLIEGIRLAIESASQSDKTKAQELFLKFKNSLISLPDNAGAAESETISKTFRRLYHLGLADHQTLDSINVTLPNLAGPFSENLANLNTETNEIKKIINLIENNSELSAMIYPVVLVFGSGLKGYGERQADIDLGVFVKPETLPSEKTKLRELLNQVFVHEKLHGETIEFWLNENKDELSVHDFSEPDHLQGESHWTHILFGAAWEGDQRTIDDLRQKLLAPYLFKTDKQVRGRPAHNAYLEEMERDFLQYRLMHKGYERIYAPSGGIDSDHSDEIDSNSMFYDSGYRQLATKLYLKNVFLPEIKKPV